jgi:DNA-cytosine methyltransferase
MNVLSLFDGISCGRQALERSGIKVDQYFASEIDKYAIKVTMANYPKTIQLGSVTEIDGYKLPKIDLLIGGSPCQSFSFAGKRKGMSTKDEQEILTLDHYLKLKSENFEFEGQSYLFWEYMRILNEVKPTYFLLENVMMSEKWEKILTKAIGVNGIHLNSALVSAQNRKRIYWTNIGMMPGGLFGDLQSIIEQPKDKGILLKDILESDVDDKYYLSQKMINGFMKHNENHIKKGTGFIFSPTEGNKKGACLRANAAICATDNTIIVHNMMQRSSTNGNGGTGHLTRTDGKTFCVDTYQSNAVKICGADFRKDEGFRIKEDGKIGILLSRARTDESCGQLVFKGNKRQVKQLSKNNKSNGGTQPYQQDRIYDIDGISPAIQSQISNGSHMINTPSIRRLTPIECERLQTVEDNYTNYVSDSQRYKMLGNGWTIDIIVHILNYLKK